MEFFMVLFTMFSTETKVTYNHNDAMLPGFMNTSADML